MATLSKAEYLKKYLSDGAETEKKKKKKKKKIKTSQANVRRLKIVDDDVDFKSLLPDNLGNTLEEDIGDDEPVIADFIDERPEYVKQLEKYRQDRRWRILGDDKKDGTGSDLSPQRRKQHDSDSDQSLPTRKRHSSDSDQSRTQRKRHDSYSDQSPPRRKRHDLDSDQSPPRRKRHDSDSDQSPPRRRRHDSEQSPPRRRRHDSYQSSSKRKRRDLDQSPPRRRKHDSGSDQSPPRRQRHGSGSDQSPPRKRRHDSGSDQSPPRRTRHDSGSDQSPPRRRSHDSGSDQSPPRRRRHDSGSDQSPPRRKRHDSDSDQSLKSKKVKKVGSGESAPDQKKKSRWEADEESYTEEEKNAIASEAIKDARGRAVKTLGGATAGLSSAAQMKHEAKLMKQREEEVFKKLGDEALGRNAKTVHRDKKSGRRRNPEEETVSAEDAAKAAEKAEKYKAWNKGLKQAQLQQQALEEVINEMDKPLTRHRDDADLDAHLKAQEREGDPMLAFIKKKKANKEAKKKEIPRYSGPEPPPNRFNIWPGYRWDGVDRSNGFEKKFFSKLSEKKAIKEIAYKWSVEDM